MTSVIALMLLMVFSGCGDDVPQKSPIDISLQQAYNSAWHYYYPKVLITSKADKVTINNVIVNKGNCQPAFKINSTTLKYGEQMEVRYRRNCNVIRVEAVTDQGNWVSEFSN